MMPLPGSQLIGKNHLDVGKSWEITLMCLAVGWRSIVFIPLFIHWKLMKEKSTCN